MKSVDLQFYSILRLYYVDNNIYQAIDLGVVNIVAGINSHVGKAIVIKNPRIENYWHPKIDELKSKRDHCIKFSNKWYWYNDKLKKIYQKQTNQQRDFQHKLSKSLIENTKANTLVIGDLDVKGMNKSEGNKQQDKSLHRNMFNTGITGRFSGFLTYKAHKIGKKIIRISERDTSKTCCYCGKKEKRMLSERTIKCDRCGLVIDRDINASVNIMQRFLAVLSLSPECLLVGQQLLKEFREKFFAKYSQTSNESFFSDGVVRTRKKS
ncbi:MAG: transposase [Candidatus Heimdallarchaeota archaeon]|nr:transposase [Candidatus Heimdallarchaeota archaeon]